MQTSVTAALAAFGIAAITVVSLTVSPAHAAPAAAGPLPQFDVDRQWPKLPPGVKPGPVSAVGIDGKDNAWVLSRPGFLKPEDRDKAAPPIMIFDPSGNYIRGWGGPAAGYEWPEREHSIYIDHKGYVWIGGNYCRTLKQPGRKQVSDDQLLKFTQDGKFVMQIGHSDQGKSNSDTANFDRPADMRVSPQTDELFVADGYGNHRVIVLDAETGSFRRMWGAFGKQPQDDSRCGQNEPEHFDGDGPANFGTVHGIRISNDGLVYVADRENRRIQAFTTDGKFVKQVTRYDDIFARNLALSSDPEQRFIYSGYAKGIAVLDRRTMTYLGTVQPPGISGPGHLIETDSKGNIYIGGGRGLGVQRLIFKGMAAN